MIVAQVCAFITIICALLDCQCLANSTNDAWKPVTVSKALLGNQTWIKKSFPSPSDVVCAMQATRTHWANLFCYNNGICDVSSFLAIPYESQTPISDPVNCMTKLDGCIYNGLNYQQGQTALLNAPDCYLSCKSGGWMTAYPVKNIASSGSLCPGNFTQVGSFGCFLATPSWQNFCDSRKLCQDQGGDLWNFEQNFTSAYLTDVSRPAGWFSIAPEFYVAMYIQGPGPFWISGTSVNTSTSNIWWEPSQLNGPAPFGLKCTRTAWQYLWFEDCSVPRRAICHWPVKP